MHGVQARERGGGGLFGELEAFGEVAVEEFFLGAGGEGFEGVGGGHFFWVEWEVLGEGGWCW